MRERQESEMQPGGEDRWVEDRWLEEQGLEERLDRALAAGPEIRVSADFAARVMASLPTQPTVAVPTRYGRAALLLSGALLMLMMLWLMAGSAHEPR